MLRAVEIGDECSLDTAEVRDEWTDRMLTAEFQIAWLTSAQSLPEFALDIGLRCTQFTWSVMAAGRIRHQMTL